MPPCRLLPELGLSRPHRNLSDSGQQKPKRGESKEVGALQNADCSSLLSWLTCLGRLWTTACIEQSGASTPSTASRRTRSLKEVRELEWRWLRGRFHCFL